MKSLSFEQMEVVQGGNSCSNVSNLINTGSLATAAISGIFVATGVGALFVGVGLLWSLGSMAACQYDW